MHGDVLDPDIGYYRDLSSHVIVGNTDELLKEIEDYFAAEEDETLTIMVEELIEREESMSRKTRKLYEDIKAVR